MKKYKVIQTTDNDIPDNQNCNLLTIYLCEVVMKDRNTLFVYLNPEKDDYVENISGINMLYKESTSKLVFDSYSSLA